MKNIRRCCLCGKFLGKSYGNNPYPLSDSGRCCDKCNEKVVVARLSARMLIEIEKKYSRKDDTNDRD